MKKRWASNSKVPSFFGCDCTEYGFMLGEQLDFQNSNNQATQSALWCVFVAVADCSVD